MDEEKKGSSGGMPGASVWLAMAVAAGAYFFHEAPLEGSRPLSTDPKPYTYVSRQDVDARLWQDPLSAVATARSDQRTGALKGSREAQPDATHGPATVADDLARRDGPLLLGVMVQGGSYAEAVESRRRARYATLAALKQFGFTPEDSAHLGYMVPKRATNDRDPALPDFVAYEWFAGAAGGRPALVLWLDEYVFATRTLDRLAALRGALAPPTASGPLAPFIVIGPTYSSTLRNVAMQLDAKRPGDDPVFYAYGASSDDTHILRGTPLAGMPLTEAFAAKGVQVTRTIADDGLIAEALRHELMLRGVDPTNRVDCKTTSFEHVVLIAEWDTLYGRTLPGLVTEALTPPGAAACDHDVVGRYVHRYSYLRGLDGQLPAREADVKGEGKESSARDAAGAANRAALRREIERPDGQGQLDYLRRMAADLKTSDAERQRDGQGAIRAIGVLGSDVFDKLLILQALRAEFPDAVFFTTDLDARMIHPQEQAWARNLVVASGFGLKLNENLQQDIPPFRDSYQTSIYLSTLIGLFNRLHGTADGRTVPAKTIRGWLAEGRVFEIARTEAFDFGGPAHAPVGSCAGPKALDACGDVHPEPTPMNASSNAALFYKQVLLAAVGVLLLAGTTGFFAGLLAHAADPVAPEDRGPLPANRLRRWVAIVRSRAQLKDLRIVRRLFDRRFGVTLVDPDTGALVVEDYFLRKLVTRRVTTIVAFALALALLVVFLGYALPLWRAFSGLLTQDGAGEPISFVQGISIWPTELFRGLVVLFSIVFVYVAWRRLTDNLREISQEFRFEPTYRRMVEIVREEYDAWPMWKQVLRAFSFRLVELGGGPKAHVDGLSWSAQLFWKKYLYQGRVKARVIRVLFAVLMYLLLAMTVMLHFGFPGTPFRGVVAERANGVMIVLSVAAMLFVIFFVVDAIVFCNQIIRSLRIEILGEGHRAVAALPSKWAEATRKHFAGLIGADDRHLDLFILLRFIERRTTVVAGLVYFPFAVVAMMILARNSFFDRWSMPLGLTLVFAMSIVIIAGCAVLLRREAEATRDQILERLNEDLIYASRHDEKLALQIRALIGQTRYLSAGAFATYSQQPIVRAALLPLTTLGGPVLLEFLSSTGF